MSTEVKIKIAVDTETGELKGLNRDLGKLETKSYKAEKSTDNLSRSFGGLATVLAGVSFTYLAKELAQTADSYALMQGRIDLVTGSSAELHTVQAELFGISQDSRVVLDSTVDLYTRLARSTDTLGVSQKEVLDVTGAVNKTFAISGTSANSANAAIVQLGQGLASGTLRGDELNSVMEQSPRLAQAIADGMGVTIGQLRKYGAEGKLSSEIVFNALKSQVDLIDSEFTKMPKTIDQSIIQINNSWTDLIGTFNQEIGATESLADQLTGVSSFISANKAEIIEFGKDFGKYVTVIAEATVAYYALTATHKTYTAWQTGTGAVGLIAEIARMNNLQRVLLGATVKTKALNLATKATPWGLAIAGAVGLFEVVGNLNEAYGERDRLVKSWDDGKEARATAKAEAEYHKLGASLKSMLAFIDKTGEALKTMDREAPQFTALTNAFENVKIQVIDITGEIARQAKELEKPAQGAQNVANKSKNIATELTNATNEAYRLAAALSGAEASVEKELLRAQKITGSISKKSFIKLSAGVDISAIDQQSEDLNKLYAQQGSNVEELNAKALNLYAQRLSIQNSMEESLQSFKTGNLKKYHSASTKSIDEAAKAQERYLKALLGSDYKLKVLGDELAELGKYLSQSELAVIYDAEIKKMKDSNTDLSSDLGSKIQKAIDNITFKSLMGGLNGFAQAFSSDDPFALSKWAGSQITGIADSIIPGLGQAMQAIGAFTSSFVSQEEIDAARGRRDFDDESIRNLGNMFENVQEPLLASTYTMSEYLKSMDENFLAVAKNLTGQTGSKFDLTQSDYVGSSSSSLWGGKTTDLIGSGLVLGDNQSLSDLIDVDSIDIQGYISELVTKSSWFGLSTNQKIKITEKDLDPSVVGAISGIFADGTASIIEAAATLGITNIEDQLLGYTIPEDLLQIDVSGMDEAQANEAIAGAFSEMFSGAVAGVDSIDMLTERYAKAGEKQYETLIRIATEVDQATNLFDSIGKTFTDLSPVNFAPEYYTEITSTREVPKLDMFGNALHDMQGNIITVTEEYTQTILTTGDNIYTAQMQMLDVIEGAGGNEAFTSAMNAFISGFYTESEQLDMGIANLSESFETLGVTMPKTKDGFKDLIEGFQITDEASATLYGELVALAPAFATVFSSIAAGLSKIQAARDKYVGTTVSASDIYGNIEDGGSVDDILGQIDQYIGQEKTRASEAESARVASHNAMVQKHNAEAQANKALRESILGIKESAIDTLRSFTTTGVSMSSLMLDHSIASKNYGDIQSAYQSLVGQAKQSSATEDEFLFKIAEANAKIQDIAVPPEMAELQTISANTANIDESINNLALPLLDALEEREEGRLDDLYTETPEDTTEALVGVQDKVEDTTEAVVGVQDKLDDAFLQTQILFDENKLSTEENHLEMQSHSKMMFDELNTQELTYADRLTEENTQMKKQIEGLNTTMSAIKEIQFHQLKEAQTANDIQAAAAREPEEELA